MLARMAISGGAPAILDDVQSAGLVSDETACTRAPYKHKLPVELSHRSVLYETPGWLDYVRVSPNGKQGRVHRAPVLGDSRGSGDDGRKRQRATVISPDWSDVVGLAWSPTSDEVWFTASDSGISRALFAATTSAK